MPPNAEQTVAERLSAFDKVKAEAQQFAAKIKHKNREYRRTRLMAALMVSEAIGADYSEELLRKSGCSYIRVGKVPLYRDADLHTLAESILDRALKHGQTPPPDKKRAPQPIKSAPASAPTTATVVHQHEPTPRREKESEPAS